MKKKFLALEKMVMALKAIQNTNDPLYYEKQEAMVGEMRKFLREDFRALNNKQLLNLISWCSTYRPYAPHSILLTFSMLNDKPLPTKQG